MYGFKINSACVYIYIRKYVIAINDEHALTRDFAAIVGAELGGLLISVIPGISRNCRRTCVRAFAFGIRQREDSR